MYFNYNRIVFLYDSKTIINILNTIINSEKKSNHYSNYRLNIDFTIILSPF